MIASAPPAVVPAIIVAVFALGTALGFALVRQAIAVRAAQLVPGAGAGAGAGAADEARAAIADISPQTPPADAYAQLAAALRHYLDARFGIESAAMPGAEIERAMTRAGVTRPAARMTAHLLERCDRMRAGAADPVTPERLAADIANAREIIDLTSTST